MKSCLVEECYKLYNGYLVVCLDPSEEYYLTAYSRNHVSPDTCVLLKFSRKYRKWYIG